MNGPSRSACADVRGRRSHLLARGRAWGAGAAIQLLLVLVLTAVGMRPAAAQDATDFCPATGTRAVYSIVNGVDIYRYTPGAGNDAVVPALHVTVSSNVNGLMIDPVRNRLLFVSRPTNSTTVLWAYDAGNGGWYQAVPEFASPDFPRAGMTPGGVGYLIAGGSSTPQVWRVDPNPTGYGYTVQNIGNLTYDIAPTDLGSGDIAIDADGAGWLSAGQDLYRIDFANSLVAVRQTRPLLNGAPSTINWAGVAFADDGTLYVANNSGTSRYYGYNPQTGALTAGAPTTANGSRDLASCAFPRLSEPELGVVKTLATVNGAAAGNNPVVYAGDVLGYDITVRNTGGAVGTLFAGDVVDTLPANTSRVAAGNDFTCSGSTCTNASTVNVPAGGTAVLHFVARVAQPLPGTVTRIDNTVAVDGVDCAAAGNDCVENTPVGPGVSVAKTADPASGTQVAPGQTVNYTLTVTVSNAATTAPVVLADTLGNGLTFGAVTSAGAFTCSGALDCTLPAGTAPGTYPVRYSATVNANATGRVGNSVVPSGADNPTCSTCTTEHPVVAPTVSVAKTSDPAPGAQVTPGQTLNYTVTVTVANSATTAPVNLADTLGNGLTFGAVTSAGAFTCSGALNCTLPAGTAPGTYPVRYSATVNANATGTVGNRVTASGADNPTCGTCTTEHPVVATAVSVAKTSDPAPGTQVAPGQALNYTVTVTVANSATTAPLVLADTLGNGLTFGAVTSAGAFTCSGALNCTLPAGTLPGTYPVRYSATVNATATGTVGNRVVPSGADNPACVTCTTEHPVVATAVSVVKTADPAPGTQVAPGQTLNYTVTVTVANSATTAPVVLSDTLGNGLTFGAVTSAGAFTCSGALNCTLPAGTLPGTYPVRYSATVNANATGTVGNRVTASGADNPACSTCTTEHPVVAPAVRVTKTSDPASGAQVAPGQTLDYTVTVTVANSATTAPVVLSDTLGNGLTFGAVTSTGAFTCSGALNCTLPAGTLPGSYPVRYSATVNANATGTVGNRVTPSGADGPTCVTCTTEHPVVVSAVSVTKRSDPASGAQVAPGQTLNYTVTVTVANSATTAPVVLADTLGSGLTFGAVTSAGAFNCSGALSCTLPAGTLPGSYPVRYSATVNANATGTVGNSVVPSGADNPTCSACTTEHPLIPAAITVGKTSDPAPGAQVAPGQTLNYTVTVTVANSATTAPVVLADTLGNGLTFGAVTSAGAFTCSGALNCTLPAGTLPGSYPVRYSATVDANATGTVANRVTASGADNPTCGTCTTEHPLVPSVVTVSKTSDPAPGAEVRRGQSITYTLTAVVEDAATTGVVTLADTLRGGQTLSGPVPAGCTATGDGLSCALPAGTLPGRHAFSYAVTVDADASGTVGNSVVASGVDAPRCSSCATEHPVAVATVAVSKSADPGPGATVSPGDSIAYALTVEVAGASTRDAVTLTDTFTGAQTLAGDLPAGCAATATGLVCTLPAGTLPGRHAFAYRATVDATASGRVGNTVVPSGADAPTCGTCATEHAVVRPVVTVAKTSDPASGSNVIPGQVIAYTVTVTVAAAPTSGVVTLTDTLSGDQTLTGALPAGCTGSGQGLTCALPARTAIGTHTFVYSATVAADASGTVGNTVVPSGIDAPSCDAGCATQHPVVSNYDLRLRKSVSVGQVRIGDLVRYTVTVENVGQSPFVGGSIVDTPPPGFTYVDGSLVAGDGDNAATVAGQSPIRIDGVDVGAGQTATFVYLMRVGAGVRQGTQVNRAVALTGSGEPVSNVSTASVSVESDPLVDQSLVFGTVFDDRDGDGWQDSADITGLRVQGGFAAAAYVPGSTVMDAGAGWQPLADASAPLLHGIAVGGLRGRQSSADPVQAHQVVIRQVLREAAFTDDFVLTTDQGVRVRMDAAGRTTVERQGAAAKGLNAAEPTVERRVSQGQGGVIVDYVIANAGIDERGVPGVRIASVEGLLIETDQFGRFHLEDVDGGNAARGRNFILKVDPSTLPPGAAFTTANPLLRRITPGLPVRFDFGVRLPVEELAGEGGTLELELGQVLFAPGSSEVRSEYLAAVDRIAAQVRAHRGGEVLIAADGEAQALAFDRATAVKTALLERLDPATAAALTLSLRTDVRDPASMTAGIEAGGPRLGTVLFDTDQARIKPQFAPLLDRIAAYLERQGGGVVSLVGHADRRASDAYNTALGMRRAQAVYEALAGRLSPELRARIQVQANADPTAPSGVAGQ
ncbi:OmpA family protein [Pseudoxanthomonas sp. X-1]|uniref:OmpA family protein n=1 Tax=Pseudoxanthomonas sp. X-1 TaxID=2571115 RepID=UPI00110A9092|nr:OmpA family protein [Pseudoxanthomonas sp. X-1]TMN18089.1 DUF11 domain-containing protein [Pseudoxanthomonas sp. X-1]